MSDRDNGDFIGHRNCVANEFEYKDGCKSGDGLALYIKSDSDGQQVIDGYCWSCHQNFSVKEISESSLAKELGVTGGVTATKFEVKPKCDPITFEQLQKLKAEVGFTDKPYRKLKPEWLRYFGFMVKRDHNGNPLQIYYPETSEEGKVHGFKIRILPKNFSKIGRTGLISQLGGQFRYKAPTKRLLIVGGENDGVASFGMFKEYYDGRKQGHLENVHVVWGTCGEGSLFKQLSKQYDFVDGYEEIYLGIDNDEAGEKAISDCVKVLPAEKLKIVKWSAKDPHKLLEDGKEAQFIRDFFNAKNYVDTGIKTSNQTIDDIKDVLLAEKVTLPNYMCVMERMMKRAFTRTGRVVNIIGTTSCGKSTHVNNMTYHWMFSEGLKPLIISLEMTAGEYAIDLLSLHLKKNLDWFDDGMDAWNYLQREDVKEMYDDLFYDEEFNERFCIVDDRDGSIESIKKLIEKGVKKHGCNIVIIDVLSDILRFLPMDEQEKFMSWEKNFAKGNVNIVNVLHTKKLERDREGNLRKATEYDALGSSTFVQSAHINIVINRDKMAECNIEKNTTYVDMPKCRRGTTGEAGKWYYDQESRQCYDFDTFFSSGRQENPEYKPSMETVPIVGKKVVEPPPLDLLEVDYEPEINEVVEVNF